METAEVQLNSIRNEFAGVFEDTKVNFFFMTKKSKILSRDEYAERNKCLGKKRNNCMDELEGNRESLYHCDIFIFAVIIAISSMNRRFTSRKAILTNFSLLNLECFHKTIEKQLWALKKVAKDYGLESCKGLRKIKS